MPKEFIDCIKKRLDEGKSKDEAYAICTKIFIDKYGISPKEWDKKHGKGEMYDSIYKALKDRTNRQ